MKLLNTLILFTISFAFLNAQSSVEEIDDFRGMKWGTKIDKAHQNGLINPVFNLQRVVSPKIKVYTLPNDDQSLGTVQLDEILYFFHEDAGFFKVIMSGSASENDEMDAVVSNRLGDNYETIMNPANSHKVWRFPTTVVDYRQQASEDFLLLIKSNVIQQYMMDKNDKITDF